MTDSFDGVIVGEALIVGQNTFLTASQSLALAGEMLGVDAFVNADAALQTAALIDAYERICSMEIRSRILPPAIAYDENGDEIRSMGDLDALGIASLPLQMRKAFMKAQLLEANVLLNGDPTGDMRKAGVMSYTVGEVKQFFRTVKPLDFTISMKALGQIGKYIQYNRGIARA